MLTSFLINKVLFQERLSDGRDTILTLDDRNVLDEDGGDVLVNVNIQDQERYDKVKYSRET